MRIAQKLKEAEITEEDSPSLKKCFNDKLNPALGLDMEMKTLMPKSHRVIDLKEKGVYDALQSKSLMFRVCESVDGPMIKEYSFSFSYSDSQSQDVITRTGNKKQGGTFNSTAGITPNQMRSSACKMVPTLVQFKRSLDKMPEKQDNDDADHTQDPVQNERQLARVKDWFNSRHLHTLELTDVLSKSPDISVINQTQENESVAYSDNQQHLYSKPSGLALGSSRAVCTFFLHGRCKFGKQCRFLHQDPSPPPRPPPKKDYDDSFWMKIPDKSKALECLPKETLKRLEDEDSVDISSDIAKRCLDTRRQRFIEDPGRKGPLKLRDRNDFVMMFWVTERKWVNEEGRRKKSNGIIEAMGRIRDQRYHQACWSYAGSDLVAATRVLHGLDQQFKPLCTRYLIQNVDRIKYNRHRRCNTHGCFGCSLDMGLAYIQKFGIPQEEEGYEDFRCTEDRKITSNDDLYKIENFFRYNTLEEALVRLRTHAVGATLYGFHGWDGKGIYRGPVKEGAVIVGLHAVVMCELKIINEEPIIFCRSSNGEDIGGVQGFKGYIAVAANVMFMIVGKRNTRRNAGHHRCSIKPTHLLCEFYSVGMEYKDPSFDKEDPIERKNNEKFKVDIQEFGWQMPPTIEDQRSRQNPRKRGRHCR